MQNVPDQFGPLGRAQWQAQFDLAASLSATAMDNAGKLALLQIEAARQWTLNAAEAWRHMAASAPLDWMALPARLPSGWSGMFRYPFSQQLQGVGMDSPAECAECPQPDAASVQQADLDLRAAAEPPAARTALAAAAAEAVPGSVPAHPAATFPRPGRPPLPRVKPMEAAPAPPQVAGMPPPSRHRGRGPKK